jgi:hypothetical protein
MECKKCGKLIDMRGEKQFCSGCGAMIGEEKPPQRIITRERAGPKNPITSSRDAELDTRTRFFYAACIVGFFILFIFFEFTFTSRVLAFIAAIPCGAIVAILGVMVVSRMNPNRKHSLNNILWFVPAVGPGRGFVETLASVVPLMGKLPQDTSKPGQKNQKKL